MSFANSGKSWTRCELRKYLSTLPKPAWITGITLHHTAVPSLAHSKWSAGWTAQLIHNMTAGYQAKGWRSGPHFYADDYKIWGLTPPNLRGIHARSFNSSRLGIEVLGNYDIEDHCTGRGERCWQRAFECSAELMRWLGQDATPGTVNFHRDDPLTSKSCPGTRIQIGWVLAGIWTAMASDSPAA